MAQKTPSITRFIVTSSFALIYACFMVALVVLFKPTFKEFIILFTADATAFLLARHFMNRIFLALYPETQLFARGLDETEFASLGTPEKARLIERLMRYPGQVASFMAGLSAVRRIPAVLIVIYIWHDETPRTYQLLGLLVILTLSLIYIFGTTLLECHVEFSRRMAELHEKLHLKEVFLRVRIPRSRGIQITEVIILAFIIMFTLALQWVLLLIVPDANRFELGVRGSLIGLTGLVLFLRTWYLGRVYFIGGLDQIFERMAALDLKKTDPSLPLHSSPLLSKFEQAFNLMTERVRASEEELSSLAKREAERSRFEALGEISSLIAHDLSGPLHVAQYCATELLENPESPRKLRHIEYLAANVGRAVELVDTLRAKLRSPDANLRRTSFWDAHQQVIRNLAAQFPAAQFRQVALEVDPALRPLELRIPRVDLVHILDNLYRNSIQNLLQNQISAPLLRVSIARMDEVAATLLLSDNGTGLDPQAFSQLSASLRPNPVPGSTDPAPLALGLRLTLRLIELNKGSLELVSPTQSEEHRPGTHYSLTLPRFTPESGNAEAGSAKDKNERGVTL